MWSSRRPGPLRWLAQLPLLTGLVLAFVALVSPVAAHGARPLRHEQLTAGPYTLAVLFYSAPRAGSTLQLLVVPQAAAGNDVSQLTAVARPGAGTPATLVRGQVAPDPELAGAFAVEQALPVTGAWILQFTVVGSAGEGSARLPVTAAAPGAIPEPVGWALALAPLLGLAAFGYRQWRWFRTERAGEAGAEGVTPG